MKSKFITYKVKFLDFCKKSWRLHKPVCILVGLLVVIGSCFLVPNSEKKTENAANELMLTAEKIRRFYQTKPNYWGLDNNSALATGILKHFRIVNDMAFNALGQKVFVGYGPLGESIVPGINGFDITYVDVSYEECVKLLAFPFSQAQSYGLQQVLLFDEKNNLSADFAWGAENALPVTVQNAKNSCVKHNNLLWRFE